MKKLGFLLLCTIPFINCQAQETLALQQITVPHKYKKVFHYNAQHLTSSTSHYNPNTGALMKSTYYEWNEGGNLTGKNTYFMDRGDTSMVTMEKTHYSSTGQISNKETSYWNKQQQKWVPQKVDTYTYHNGHLTKILQETFRADNEKKEVDSQYTYTYDEAGNKTSETYWDNSSRDPQLKPVNRKQWQYEKGHKTVEIKQYKSYYGEDTSWRNTTKKEMAYNANGQIETTITYRGSRDEGWKKSRKRHFLYDANHQLTKIEGYGFRNDKWLLGEKVLIDSEANANDKNLIFPYFEDQNMPYFQNSGQIVEATQWRKMKADGDFKKRSELQCQWVSL